MAEPRIAPQHLPVNVFDSSEAYVIVAPMAGVMPEDVTVELSGTSLHIAAAMRTPARKPYLLHEWHYGPYERDVELPAGGTEVSAVMGNGQLVVRVVKGAGDSAATRAVPAYDASLAFAL